MAIESVSITPGSGKDIAVDTISAKEFQVVKLAVGADGTMTALQAGRDIGSGDGAAYVDARPNVVKQSQASSGLTTSTTAYTSGDTVGAGWTFTGMARASGGTGRITAAMLLDKGDVIAGYELWLSSGSITFGTDNAAPSISDTDAQKLVARISLSPTRDLGGNRVSYADYLSVPYSCDATSLYVYAVTLNDHTFFAATSDLYLTLFAELD